MDLGLSEEQELLKNFARDFLEKECPEKHVREMEEDEQGYSQDLWKKMAEQGWQGLIIPDEQGGSGMGFIDFIILIEEFGRALVPGPFIPTAVGGAIGLMEAGSDEQKQQYLPKIATGEQIWTLALTEPTARFEAEGVELEAKAEGDSFVLSGTKLFIRDAHVADYITVVARTKKGKNAEDGITLFIVDGKSDGISTEQLTIPKTPASRRLHMGTDIMTSPISGGPSCHTTTSAAVGIASASNTSRILMWTTPTWRLPLEHTRRTTTPAS